MYIHDLNKIQHESPGSFFPKLKSIWKQRQRTLGANYENTLP